MDIAMKRGRKRARGRVMVNGKTRSKWFPDDSKKSRRAAILWETQERERMETEQVRKIPTVCSLFEWATAYLDESKRRNAPKTYREKQDCFKRVVRSLGKDTTVDNISVQIAGAYLAEQCDTRSGNAANKDRKNLSTAWAWGNKMLPGFPGGNPWLQVDKFPEIRNARYVPPECDFWAVYEEVEGQDQVMLLSFLHLAARRGEIFRMRWEDLDLINGTVSVGTRKRKGGNLEYDVLPLTRQLKESLLWWWEQRPVASDNVFVSVATEPFALEYYGQPFTNRQHFMARICKRAKVKHFGFHAIRHLTASILYHEGHSVAMIQAILRHKNPTTTERYLRRIGMSPACTALETAMSNHVQGKVLKLQKKEASGG